MLCETEFKGEVLQYAGLHRCTFFRMVKSLCILIMCMVECSVKKEMDTVIKYIDDFVETVYPCATDEDEYLIRKDTAVLFGKIMEIFGEHPGQACIVADMAFNTMRDMDGAASDVARDYLNELIELTGITPEELSEEDMRSASEAIYGNPDAFVY